MPSQHDFEAEKHSVLPGQSKSVSVLEYAELLQSRAAAHGFDWPDIEPVFGKLFEEIAELKVEVAKLGSDSSNMTLHVEHKRRVQDELGDVLFCCVNIARFLDIKPEDALKSTNEKFLRRFRFIEKELYARSCKLKDVSLEDLDLAWDRAKSQENE